MQDIFVNLTCINCWLFSLPSLFLTYMYLPESQIQKNFLFIQTNSFIIFTCFKSSSTCPGLQTSGLIRRLSVYSEHKSWSQRESVQIDLTVILIVLVKYISFLLDTTNKNYNSYDSYMYYLDSFFFKKLIYLL